MTPQEYDITELIEFAKNFDGTLTPIPRSSIDRYCLAPCVNQQLYGVCDCTRRIEREVLDYITSMSATKKKHNHDT